MLSQESSTCEEKKLVKFTAFKLISGNNSIRPGSPSLWAIVTDFELEELVITKVSTFLLKNFGPGIYRLYSSKYTQIALQNPVVVESNDTE